MMTRRLRLEDIADLAVGFAFKSAEFSSSESGVRLLRGDNIAQGQTRWGRVERWPDENPVDPRYELRQDDIVLAMDRPWIEAGLKFARIQSTDLPAFLVQRVARLRAKPGTDQRYLASVIGSAEFTDHVLSIQTGTAVPHISARQIGQYLLQLPELHEQRAIAGVLGALDDKIAANTKLMRALDDYFVARWRLVESRAESSSRPLDSLILDSIGGDWGVDQATPIDTESVYCIRGADISSLQESRLGKTPSRFIKPTSLERRSIRSGDIVVEMSGGSPTQSTGRAALVTGHLLNRLKKPMVSSNFCRVLRLTDPTYSYFVYAMLRRDWTSGEFFQFENGSTGIKNLAFREYSARKLVGNLSPGDIASFNSAAESLFGSSHALGDECERLKLTRDALLPQLMSGKLRVRDVEKLVEAVV